ncbi:hypothetical protein HDV00_004483 [Rhizophlyctis rosea]|nr:hypothetical protein HDV00_004483 [Rhizophlyctis rosea]
MREFRESGGGLLSRKLLVGLTDEETTGRKTVKRALVMVHGLQEDAYTMYRLALTAAKAKNYTREDTMVITPKFLCTTLNATNTHCYDAQKKPVAERAPTQWPLRFATGVAYDADGDLDDLEKSIDPNPVLDIHWQDKNNGPVAKRLIDWSDENDDWENWLAGGEGKCRECGGNGRLGVYSMSSVMYPTPERPVTVTKTGPCQDSCTVSPSQFAIPPANANCNGTWDDQMYGLSNLSPPPYTYISANPALALTRRNQILDQYTTYLIGHNDTSGPDLDCPDAISGFSRRQRANYHAAYVKMRNSNAVKDGYDGWCLLWNDC